MVVHKPTPKLTYQERVLGAISTITRNTRKHTIHHQSVRAQIRRAAAERQEQLPKTANAWTTRALHTLADNRLLESEGHTTYALSNATKDAFTSARARLGFKGRAPDDLSVEDEDALLSAVADELEGGAGKKRKRAGIETPSRAATPAGTRGRKAGKPPPKKRRGKAKPAPKKTLTDLEDQLLDHRNTLERGITARIKEIQTLKSQLKASGKNSQKQIEQLENDKEELELELAEVQDEAERLRAELESMREKQQLRREKETCGGVVGSQQSLLLTPPFHGDEGMDNFDDTTVYWDNAPVLTPTPTSLPVPQPLSRVPTNTSFIQEPTPSPSPEMRTMQLAPSEDALPTPAPTSSAMLQPDSARRLKEAERVIAQVEEVVAFQEDADVVRAVITTVDQLADARGAAKRSAAGADQLRGELHSAKTSLASALARKTVAEEVVTLKADLATILTPVGQPVPNAESFDWRGAIDGLINNAIQVDSLLLEQSSIAEGRKIAEEAAARDRERANKGWEKVKELEGRITVLEASLKNDREALATAVTRVQDVESELIAERTNMQTVAATAEAAAHAAAQVSAADVASAVEREKTFEAELDAVRAQLEAKMNERDVVQAEAQAAAQVLAPALDRIAALEAELEGTKTAAAATVEARKEAGEGVKRTAQALTQAAAQRDQLNSDLETARADADAAAASHRQTEQAFASTAAELAVAQERINQLEADLKKARADVQIVEAAKKVAEDAAQEAAEKLDTQIERAEGLQRIADEQGGKFAVAQEGAMALAQALEREEKLKADMDGMRWEMEKVAKAREEALGKVVELETVVQEMETVLEDIKMQADSLEKLANERDAALAAANARVSSAEAHLASERAKTDGQAIRLTEMQEKLEHAEQSANKLEKDLENLSRKEGELQEEIRGLETAGRTTREAHAAEMEGVAREDLRQQLEQATAEREKLRSELQQEESRRGEAEEEANRTRSVNDARIKALEGELDSMTTRLHTLAGEKSNAEARAADAQRALTEDQQQSRAALDDALASVEAAKQEADDIQTAKATLEVEVAQMRANLEQTEDRRLAAHNDKVQEIRRWHEQQVADIEATHARALDQLRAEHDDVLRAQQTEKQKLSLSVDGLRERLIEKEALIAELNLRSADLLKQTGEAKTANAELESVNDELVQTMHTVQQKRREMEADMDEILTRSLQLASRHKRVFPATPAHNPSSSSPMHATPSPAGPLAFDAADRRIPRDSGIAFN